MTIQTKRYIAILLAVAFILLIPFIAMQFTTEVNWTLFDFVIAGGLLLGTSFLGEYFIRITNKKYRTAVIILLIAAFILIWLELAVGIFGTAIAGD